MYPHTQEEQNITLIHNVPPRLRGFVADADEFIKLVARRLNRYNIIKKRNMYTIKEHNYTVNGKRTQLSE